VSLCIRTSVLQKYHHLFNACLFSEQRCTNKQCTMRGRLFQTARIASLLLLLLLLEPKAVASTSTGDDNPLDDVQEALDERLDSLREIWDKAQPYLIPIGIALGLLCCACCVVFPVFIITKLCNIPGWCGCCPPACGRCKCPKACGCPKPDDDDKTESTVPLQTSHAQGRRTIDEEDDDDDDDMHVSAPRRMELVPLSRVLANSTL
jgi:hypothetical protein